jgi:hypothetical protein
MIRVWAVGGSSFGSKGMILQNADVHGQSLLMCMHGIYYAIFLTDPGKSGEVGGIRLRAWGS